MPAIGSLVIVPFGKRLRRGWVVGFAEEAPVDDVKPLAATLSEAPVLSAAQIALARWLSRRANVRIAYGLSVAAPGALLDRCLPRLRFAAGGMAALEAHGRATVMLRTRLKGGPIRLDRAWQSLPASLAQFLPEMERSGAVERLPPAAGEPVVASSGGQLGPLPLLPGRATRELCSAVFADVTKERGSVFVATTGCWPTAAVEHLVRHAMSEEKQALIMLPRAGIYSEQTRALAARFPGALVAAGQAGFDALAHHRPALTIGGRLTPFGPFDRLGLVLVFDEHDSAYAGAFPPFVHGREIALQAARFARATTVLFSPTPDPATLWRASRAGVRRFALGALEPVHVTMVDLRQELRAGREALLTAPLRRTLAETIAAGGQALLLLNRRGAAFMVICRRCGVPLQCRRCSVTLVYHAEDSTMRCHCCNDAQPRPAVCPHCRTATLHDLGTGVEKLEQDLQRSFPTARLARWDSDSVAGAAAGRALVRRFTERQLDVLVGTQPVALADGLPPVALAAAVASDVGLHQPDYRAAERSYELLSALRRRVVGGGQFILQTYHPAHWVFQALAADDPSLFYGEELRRRQELGYPPFQQLARLTYRATSLERCEAEARKVGAALVERLAEVAPGLSNAVLGPAPAPIERVNGVYRWQIYLRAPNVQPLLSVVPPHWTVEVDPEDLR